MEDDILVELSDSELQGLANMYESHKNQLPYLHSFLQNCLKAKKNGMSDFVTVYSPRNCWSDDGTFIASMPIHGHDIVLHSLDPSGKNLIEGLTKTRSIKFNQDPARNYTLFFAVHELFYPKITKVLSEVLKHEIIVSEDINFWCLEREKAVQFDIPYSNDVYVKQLETSDIPTLNSYWGFNYPASEQKLLDCWKLCKGYGVYLKSSDQLVSWVASSCLGQTSALQTVDEHKKKGFASLAVMGMAKYLAEKGFDCCGTVLIGNTVSGGFFQRLGFERRFKGQYIGVLNKY